MAGRMTSAATKRVFGSINRGIEEAVAHARGEKSNVRIHYPREIDVALLRRRINMTQAQFAARFGFSVATLRHWERGDRRPQGAALVLLNVIDRDPQAVIDALR